MPKVIENHSYSCDKWCSCRPLWTEENKHMLKVLRKSNEVVWKIKSAWVIGKPGRRRPKWVITNDREYNCVPIKGGMTVNMLIC